jgi:hypothetical protein
MYKIKINLKEEAQRFEGIMYYFSEAWGVMDFFEYERLRRREIEYLENSRLQRMLTKYFE